MKVTVENIKGLNKDLKVFVDKKTISSYMDEKYEEVKNNVTLKGFRPGKVPKEILKRLNGWQLKSFEESYKYKVENGISLIKKQNLK